MWEGWEPREQAASRSWKGQGGILPSEPPEGTSLPALVLAPWDGAKHPFWNVTELHSNCPISTSGESLFPRTLNHSCATGQQSWVTQVLFLFIYQWGSASSEFLRMDNSNPSAIYLSSCIFLADFWESFLHSEHWILLLCWVYKLQIFSASLTDCPFRFFKQSMFLMSSNRSVFYFMVCGLCASFKKSFPDLISWIYFSRFYFSQCFTGIAFFTCRRFRLHGIDCFVYSILCLV